MAVGDRNITDERFRDASDVAAVKNGLRLMVL